MPVSDPLSVLQQVWWRKPRKNSVPVPIFSKNFEDRGEPFSHRPRLYDVDEVVRCLISAGRSPDPTQKGSCDSPGFGRELPEMKRPASSSFFFCTADFHRRCCDLVDQRERQFEFPGPGRHWQRDGQCDRRRASHHACPVSASRATDHGSHPASADVGKTGTDAVFPDRQQPNGRMFRPTAAPAPASGRFTGDSELGEIRQPRLGRRS